MKKLISLIGKKSGTDMEYITKNGGWLFLGNIASIIFSLALTLAFANLLPQEVYGNYRYIISIMSIVGILSITGLTNTLTQGIAKGFMGSFKESLRLQRQWIFVPLLFTLALSVYYFLKENILIFKLLIITAALFPAYKFFSLFDAYLVGKKDFKKKTIFNIIQNLLTAILLLLVLVFSDNIYLIVTTYLLSLVVPSYFFLRNCLKDYKNFSEAEKEIDPSLKQNSFHLSVLNAIGKISTEIDKILIFHYLGPVKLAIYSFAIAPITKAEGSLLMVRDLILPKISTKTAAELKKGLPRKILFFSLLLIPFVIFYIIISPYLFSFLLPGYMESVIYTKYLAISVVFSLPILIFNQTLIVQMEKRGLYTTRILSPVIKIILMAVFIPMFGILGAVFSVILGSVANLLILIVLFYRMKDSSLTKIDNSVIN